MALCACVSCALRHAATQGPSTASRQLCWQSRSRSGPEGGGRVHCGGRRKTDRPVCLLAAARLISRAAATAKRQRVAALLCVHTATCPLLPLVIWERTVGVIDLQCVVREGGEAVRMRSARGRKLQAQKLEPSLRRSRARAPPKKQQQQQPCLARRQLWPLFCSTTATHPARARSDVKDGPICSIVGLHTSCTAPGWLCDCGAPLPPPRPLFVAAPLQLGLAN